MIENPYPAKWQDLQRGVSLLFNEVGIKAEVGRKFNTPRGTVEIDVYAVDETNTDNIRYIVECKNWNKTVPQEKVHAFTTVMHEVGANIGFLISKKGLQPGARAYIKNTNIVGLTYSELQSRYFADWSKNFFVPSIGNNGDSLLQYVEPFNSYRDRRIRELSDIKKECYLELLKSYRAFGMNIGMFEFRRYFEPDISPLAKIEELKNQFITTLGVEFTFTSIYYRDLLFEIVTKIKQVTGLFNEIFGEDIFKISRV